MHQTVIPGKRFLIKALKLVECEVESLDLSSAAHEAGFMCANENLKLLSIEPAPEKVDLKLQDLIDFDATPEGGY